jgi:hypothetical protein
VAKCSCKGRGVKKPAGLGLPVTCEDCGGTGEKKPATSSKPRPDYGARPTGPCTYEGRVDRRECYGAKTWDHIVPRRAIIAKITGGRVGLDPDTAKTLRDALSDPRNLIVACWGCNMLRETGNEDCRPEEEDLPHGFWDFVAQYDLHGDVPRHLKPLDPGRSAAGNPEPAALGGSAGGPGSTATASTEQEGG